METASISPYNSLLLPKCKCNLGFKDDLKFTFTQQVYSKPKHHHNGKIQHGVSQQCTHIHNSASYKNKETYKIFREEDTDKVHRKYFGMLRVADKGKNLAMGKMVHAQMIKSGMESDIFLYNYVLSIYTKLQKDLQEAQNLFREMSISERDDVSWTTMISAYAKRGMVKECWQHFIEMLKNGIGPNTFTFTAVVPLTDLKQCKQVHSCILKILHVENVDVENVLISTYSKLGSLNDARKVFDNMEFRDAGSWNAIIGSYARNSLCEETFKIFVGMLKSGIRPEDFSLSSVLMTVLQLDQGKQIHALVIKSGFGSNIYVSNSLVNMYSKHGEGAEFAYRVFVNMPMKNEISWATMISAFTRSGQMHDALNLLKQTPMQSLMVYNSMLSGLVHNKEEENACLLFQKMIKAGFKVDKFTFCSILTACRDSSLGMQIHGHIVKSGIERHLWVGTALISMYCKMSLPWEAYKVFTMMTQHNQVTYIVMLCGFSRNGFQLEALDLLREMYNKFGVLNKFALSRTIVACGSLGCVDKGRQLHAHALRVGHGLDVGVCNSLITMYSKCGCLEQSLKIFDGMHERDIFSWNAMILGFVQHGMMNKALQLFQLMTDGGQIKPNEITFRALKPASVSP